MTSYALITAIEGDKDNLNNQLGIKTVKHRKFESEAIECFSMWRKNAGWLKDITIYAYCPTRNTITDDTKDKLKELGVTYIEKYQPITETFTTGFINVPLVGSILEDEAPEDVFIKIDLDMNIIKPLPEELVNSVATNDSVICGQYDDYCTAQQRSTSQHWGNPFDTGFTISRRESKFYTFFYDQVMKTMVSDDPIWAKVKADSGEYFLEEYVMDKIHNEGAWSVIPIQRYQIGEWYTPVSEFTDEELDQVYFWHEHLDHDPAYDKVREKIEYFKRIRNK
jgi:hypothetical protein